MLGCLRALALSNLKNLTNPRDLINLRLNACDLLQRLVGLTLPLCWNTVRRIRNVSQPSDFLEQEDAMLRPSVALWLPFFRGGAFGHGALE